MTWAEWLMPRDSYEWCFAVYMLIAVPIILGWFGHMAYLIFDSYRYEREIKRRIKLRR